MNLRTKEESKPLRVFLIGTDLGEDPLYELQGLVHTLDMECAGSLILSRLVSSPKFGIGSGKAAEIAEHAKAAEADCIIFDFEISPTQQRNWEKLALIPVFDRQELILRIFAERAQTKEAVLQVELARLTYSLPRLAHMYGDMARQRGGSYGTKGSGETQLELDRRGIQTKIARIKQELKKVIKERNTMRKKRDKIPLPVCALVGYTNAGKSSLLNTLTGADVFVEDKLFATLDPTTRRLSVSGGSSILITDTVGFISNLPHSLIDAFKSTLEEAERSDLLLIVLDASDKAALEQYHIVTAVLDEIGAGKNKRIIVLNKIDALQDKTFLAQLEQKFPDAVKTSAKTKEGLLQLAERLSSELMGTEQEYKIPIKEQELLNLIRRTGNLGKSLWQEEYILCTAHTSGKTKKLLEPYSFSATKREIKK